MHEHGSEPTGFLGHGRHRFGVDRPGHDRLGLRPIDRGVGGGIHDHLRPLGLDHRRNLARPLEADDPGGVRSKPAAG